MGTRNFAYDHPHYKVHREFQGNADVASQVRFGQFRSRVKVLVTEVVAYLESLTSQVSMLITLWHGVDTVTGSAVAIRTLQGASVGQLVTFTINRTLVSLGEALWMTHSEGGQFHFVYDYRILEGENVTVP